MVGTTEVVRSQEVIFQWGRGYTVKKGWVHLQRRKSCYCSGEDRVEGVAPECRASCGPSWDREVKAPSPGSHLEFFSQSGEETPRHSFLAVLWHLGGDIPC